MRSGVKTFDYIRERKRLRKKTPLLLITAFLFTSFISQISPQSTDIMIEQIFLDQGLSQSIVKCICQDSEGFMFFGTEDGLNKYDGYKFSVIKHNPRDSNSISYNDITALLASRSGMIWIGTFNAGLNRYDQISGSLLRIQHNPADPNTLSHDNITAIIEDGAGNLWVGTENGLNMLTLVDSSKSIYKVTRFRNDPNDAGSLSGNHVLSLLEDKTGYIWIGTDDGLNKMTPPSGSAERSGLMRFKNSRRDSRSLSGDIVRAIFQDSGGSIWIGTDNGLNRIEKDKNGREIFIRYNDVSGMGINDIYAISEDKKGNMWIGTNGGGIILLNKKNGEFVTYSYDSQNPGSLSYNEIRSLFRDRSGIMWIGTYGGGICKVSRGARQFVHYYMRTDILNSLSHPIVWCIYEDKKDNLWIGTHGGGMNMLNRKTGRYTYFTHDADNPNSISNNVVRNIIEDKNGYLWIGTNGGGLNRFDRKTGNFKTYKHDPKNPSSLACDEIRTIFIDRSGTFWIGTYGSGLDKFDYRTEVFTHFRNDPENPNSLSNDFVRIIYEDRDGIFWIGTEGGGLNKFDKKSGTFAAYKSDLKNPNSLSNDYIFSIHEDKNGILWLGTFGGGLNKFDRQTGTFKYYTTENGLPSDAIYGILEDEKGNLWMSTNNGLSEFDPRTETFRNFNENDGLQGSEFNGGSYFKSNNGEMFFGGINGFNSLYPSEVEENNFIPPVVITSFQKFNKEVKLDRAISELDEIILSHNDYVFSFEFAALDYTSPGRNKYMYKMEGLDEEWITTTASKRYANYTTLPPGKYVFRVKGSNSDGVWNEEGAMIKIIITPPYYRTWWFTLIAAVVLAGAGYVLYKRRLKNVRMKAELKTAHDAQMSIMPQADPEVEGIDISGICIPANEVGGDFFDYFWLNHNEYKFGILIGDVSGKAMKAAMTAVMTSGMIVTEANEAESTATILKRVNRPIFDKTNKQMFVAVCLASLNTKNKEFVFTNAGLNIPLLKTAGGIQFLKSEGPRFPLGVMKDVVYNERKLALNSGDVIIMMTDGIYEARNRDKEQYGEERLLKLVAGMDTHKMTSTRIKTLIIRDVQDFAGRQSQHDDMTVLVVKVH